MCPALLIIFVAEKWMFMIEHVVLFKMHDSYLAEVETLRQKLEALEQTIEAVDKIETGVNFAARSDAYDLILKVFVKDEHSLKEYAVHPDHQLVLAYVKKVVNKTAVVDFRK